MRWCLPLLALSACGGPTEPDDDPPDYVSPSESGASTGDTAAPRFSLPLVPPATWCADQAALDAWGEPVVAPGFVMWDALVPDEALFPFVGACEDRPAAWIHVAHDDTIQFADVDEGVRDVTIRLNPAVFHSPLLTPDAPCDGQADLDTFLGHVLGDLMGLPHACASFHCEGAEAEALMVPTIPLCERRTPNRWDVEQFDAVLGYDSTP